MYTYLALEFKLALAMDTVNARANSSHETPACIDIRLMAVQVSTFDISFFSIFLEGRASWSHTASAGVLGFNTLHFHTAGVRSNVAEDDQNTTLSLS